MRGWFRLHSANWLTGGIQFVIMSFVLHADAPAAWPYAMIGMALVSFAAWIANYRRLRRISDTPTSQIASAAQGYVELYGRGEQPDGLPLMSRLANLRCLWFRYEVYEKSSDNKWALEESGESDDPFVMRDATGTCLIDPEGAEVVCSRKQTWTEDDRRYTEWLLLPQDRIYALGEFVTIGGAGSALDLDADIGALLAEWKKNQPALLKRFDLDGNGSLDLREWELARRQARRETEAQHREIRASSGTHLLRRPADGRLFLLSNYLPEKLCLQYQIWSWVHIIVILGASAAAFALF